jgi:crotonobetainyl-CoA:carnitine CoA-transferase CaiB-like acyl-CoA transferase
MQDFFKELKVVEIASVLAGPSAGLFFAELGAQVIKIENKKCGGDVTRSWKLPAENKSDPGSAYFYSVNLLKKSVFADFSVEDDLKNCLKLIAEADLVIVNFKKGDDLKFGLDFESLQKINPRLIYGSVTGFGEESDRVAYDLILQAETGFMSMNGTQESGPLKMPVAFIDLFAAHQLKEGILLALLNRERTGKGAKISISLYDAAIASLANQSSNWLNAGFVPGLSGSLHPNIAPYGEIFRTADNKLITFAIGSDSQFKSLLNVLGARELLENIKFSSNQKRVLNRGELQTVLEKLISVMNFSALSDACSKSAIPFAEIKSIDQVLSATHVSKNLLLAENHGEQLKKAVRSFVAKMYINK